MARAFAAASSQYLSGSTPPVTTYPLTMACWFRAADITNRHTLIALGDSDAGSDYHALKALGSSSGDPVGYWVKVPGYTRTANTSTGYSANTWHHAIAVGASATDRRVYIDGGSEGTNTTSATPASIDQVSLGVRQTASLDYYLDGRLAEAAIWNIALTAAQRAILALGISPLLVAPANLVAYWPLLRDTDQDLVGSYNLTPQNSPTVATHPPIVRYPVPSMPFIPGIAVPPVMPDPGTLHQGALFSGPGLSGGLSNPLHAYAGRLQKVVVIHNQATVQTVTFYDATSIPSPPDNQILVLHVDPAQSPYFLSFPTERGIPFSTGLYLSAANCDVHLWSVDYG